MATGGAQPAAAFWQRLVDGVDADYEDRDNTTIDTLFPKKTLAGQTLRSAAEWLGRSFHRPAVVERFIDEGDGSAIFYFMRPEERWGGWMYRVWDAGDNWKYRVIGSFSWPKE